MDDPTTNKQSSNNKQKRARQNNAQNEDLTPSATELQKRNARLQPNVTLNQRTRIGAPTEDEQLLQRPPIERGDFTRSDTWRVMRIMGEFVSGFDTLASVGAAVTIFGSARVTEDDAMYQSAVELARRLGEEGFAIITRLGCRLP